MEVKLVVWCAFGEEEGYCHRQQIVTLLLIPMLLEERQKVSYLPVQGITSAAVTCMCGVMLEVLSDILTQ